jgi:hypothetical protein
MKIPFVCVWLLLALVGTGCSTTGRHVQWYDGQPLSTNKIALLKIQRDFDAINVLVEKINGEPLDKGRGAMGNNTREIELLPGEYGLSVYYIDGNGGHSLSDTLINFYAEAGKIYQLRAAPEEVRFSKELKLATIGGRFTVTFWILDEETGKIVAGTPRMAPFHWYEKPE